MNSRLPKASISALLLSAALIIATAFPLQGQSTSYVPALQARDGADLGIAMVNPTLSEAKVTLTARDYTGAIIQNNAITNPVTLALPASGQIAMRAAELFGSGISGQAGWVEVSASTAAVKGLFSVYDSGLSFIDVGEFATPASRLIFPKVSGSLATELNLVNIGPQAIQATLSLYTNDGQLFSAQSMSIPAFSGFTSSLDELVPSATNFEGYAVMDSGVSAGSRMSETLVGFETYRNHSDIALVRAFPESARLRTGFLAHLASQGGYSTKLTLVNFSGDSQIVRITADGLQSGGSPRTPPSVTVERTLAPNARLEESAEQMFNLSGEALIDGYIRFETETDTPGVIGFLDYGTTDGVALSAVEAKGEGYSNLFFSQVVEGAGFYTGLALLNPNNEPSIVTLDVFDTAGNRTGSTIVNLDSGEREAGLLSQFLQTDINQFGGYIRLTATRPIFALELFGSRNPSTFLASAPAQGESLQPQTSGREVDASVGANVISNDGSTSLLIPSEALKSNSSIKVEPISVTGLPLASGNRRPVSAVEATPAGTQFQIPVRLTFPVNAHLDPGTKIPLLIFDPQTRTYQATEFVATVDKSGRTASAEVTHFTQYVASISGSLVAISNITPSTVSPGDTVTITGSGFCTSKPQTSVTFAGNNTSIQGTVLSVSSTSIQAQVPAGAVTGPVTVRSCKQTSTGYAITVASPNPAPGTISLSPSSVPMGTTSVTLQIKGTNLMAQSVVYYDSAPIADTFGDSTLLKVTLGPFTTAGIHHLNVVNPAPGGGTSNTVDFTVTAPSGPLSIVTPLKLDKTAVSIGDTLNGTVSYKNTSAAAVTVNQIVIGARPPGGTNAGGPYSDLSPKLGVTTIQPGATAQLSASRTFTSSDPTGTWYAFPTYQDSSLVNYDGPSINFTVSASTSTSATNQPPVVSAGTNQTITLPSSATLSGTATDDGLPAGSTLKTTWSTVSGPGTVTFGNVSALSTTASFSVSGSYVLRLTASDSALSSTSDVTITVNPGTVPPASTNPLSIVTALKLDKTALNIGDTLNGTVTYKNTSAAAVTVNQIVIAARPPGGTNAGGPYSDLSPTSGVTTIQPGATVQLSASRTFTSSDPTGTWYAFPTYQDSSLVNYDGPSINFTVSASASSSPPPSTTGSGTTYYVSNSGNDGNSGTSQSSPWKTIAKVQGFLGNLRGGDSVLFQRGGIWFEQLNLSNVNGASGAPILFGNYGAGNLPIIDGGGTKSGLSIVNGRQWCMGGNSSKMSYITIDGFECRNASNYGIAFYSVSNGSAGITVQNSYIHDTGDGDYGYHNQLMYADYQFWSGGAGTKFLNNRVGNCYGHNCIEIHGDMGSPLIQGNECWGWSHNCIDMHNVVGAVVDQNVVHDGLGNEAAQSAFYLENCGSGSSANCSSSNNYFDGNPASVTWSRNVVYGAVSQGAFQCQDDNGPVVCRAYNNTVNTTNGGNTYAMYASDWPNSSPTKVKFYAENNIIDTAQPFYSTFGGSFVTWDYNDRVQGGSAPTGGSHDMSVNPQYVSAGNHNFHLQSTSPVIGKGTNVGLTYSGSAPDLGAFQH